MRPYADYEFRPEIELLGNIALETEALTRAWAEGLESEHFLDPDAGSDYQAAIETLRNDGRIDVTAWFRKAMQVTGTDEPRTVERFKKYVDHASVEPKTASTSLARFIIEDSDRRKLVEFHNKIAKRALDPRTPLHEVEEIPAPKTDFDRLVAQLPDEELTEMMATADEPPDWVIPGLLAQQDRLILTGYEGKGKSTLLRQIAVGVAAGVNPFTLEPIDAQRVYLLDVENPRPIVRKKLHPIYVALKQEYQPPNLRIGCRTDGIDLGKVRDAQWLIDRAKVNDAKLIIMGPLYKMALGDPKDEQIARNVAFAIDHIRQTLGCAFIIEAHSGHASDGKARPERPYGASLWMRWPEFGLHLSDAGLLRHWRGARDEREWPTALERGGKLPWSPCRPGKLKVEPQRRWEDDPA